MCGIAAIISTTPKDEHKVRAMLAKISHRGPDSAQVTIHPSAIVGHNRLAITDSAVSTSIQPGRAGKTVVYFNGEIYNYRKVSVYKYGMTESEVLAAGFDRFGPAFVNQLNGMFAILLYYKGDWYAIRDRYGIKPLYYWINDKKAYVVSEIKSLMALDEFTPSMSDFSLNIWRCMNNVVGDNTIFSGVYHIRPGTIVNLSQWECETYWRWSFSEVKMPYTEAVDKTREFVTRAIKRQIPHVPFGTCLSGGVDSGIIRHVLGDVPSFSVGFTSVRDERELIRTQENLGYHVVYSDVENFERTMYHLENPRVGASWANYGLYELASKFVKVLFDGTGADELFGGYSWRYDLNTPYKNILSRTGEWSAICQGLLDEKLEIDTLMGRYQIDAEWFLTGVLEVVDKLSMAHSIETRVPFLDNDLVDFAVTLPSEYKVGKQVLKDAFSDVLPAAVLSGSKKGFTSPDWIQAEGKNQAQRWNNAAIDSLKKMYFS